MKSAVVAVVRDEGPHIAEWVAYQSACGFDAVVLYDNGSVDDTVQQALRLRRKIDIRVCPWPASGPDWQLSAYLNAARRLEYEFSWLAFFDTDEFLVLAGQAGLQAILAERRDAAAVAVPWAMFGSSGHLDRPAGLVIESFLYRSRDEFPPNRHIKTIARPERILGFKSSHMPEIDGEFQNLAGRPARFDLHGVLSEAPDYATGKLHHYFTRSQADWRAKIARGYRHGERDAADFASYDLNDVYDDGAASLAARVRDILGAPAPSAPPLRRGGI